MRSSLIGPYTCVARTTSTIAVPSISSALPPLYLSAVSMRHLFDLFASPPRWYAEKAEHRSGNIMRNIVPFVKPLIEGVTRRE